jgi:hypothetical protein
VYGDTDHEYMAELVIATLTPWQFDVDKIVG